VLVAELDPEATDELPILAELVGDGDAAGAGARRAVLEAVESGLPTVARLRLRELTVARLEQVLGAAGAVGVGVDAVTELRHDLPLVELGLDSLMVLELRNRLARDLDLTLPASLFYDHPTLDAVVAFLARELGVGEVEADAGTPRASSASSASSTDLLAEVEGLSLDETEAELERLAGADPSPRRSP
jgi:acyl carrier protein